MNRWQLLDKRWLIGLGMVVMLVVGGLFIKSTQSTSNTDFVVEKQFSTSLDDVALGTSDNVAIDQTSESVEVVAYADIKGEVHSPGIYQITPNMRVSGVIDLAGGMTENADVNQVNLAQIVTDQMMIYVPAEGEEVSEVVHNQAEESEITDAVNGDSDIASGQSEDKVNINTANLTEFQTLNGVGAVKAQAIIDYREANGAFQSIEDLKNVKGVGEKTFDSLKESITID
ncbi:helix-hairpin-helix domain-containing protein [Vagococcus zengguangii]|uniref:Uncharacterized protein n=1 Tax=Vagococcus zengguangii TaxID=2571750 RepID=A0A4D7CTB1_9ENTE|nr:helix-hairpin-helix domain-containing protein [Vagococcus zengguangii]QCI85680.1 hypothetical protein FA707_01265 [Vagococcus zengguangii]TLG81620.1 hypothetical protein FE258_00245 [Vagococcus zengguangii]